jgi:chromosome partitioning protein
MRAVAVASGKGGVGKTTVAVHLAAGAAAAGERVLLVDLDHGAHASTWLLGGRADVGIAEAMLDQPLTVRQVEGRPGLFMAPASNGLQTVEASLSQTFGRETVLREVIRAQRKLIDLVVFDCPPGVAFLTQSAIFAADKVIVPVIPGFMGVNGLIDIRKLVDQIRSRARIRVDIAGAVIFGADDREGIAEGTRESLRKLGAAPLFASEVRISTAGKQLPNSRATAFDPGVDPRGAEDYPAILKETRARLESR